MHISYRVYFVILINFELYNYLNMRFGEHIENQRRGNFILLCSSFFFFVEKYAKLLNVMYGDMN